jgi:16S rRNA (cytosine1402-N4)-methyltransferase
MLEFKHVPVMLSEVLTGLNIKEDGIYVDGTIGGAGHSKEIIKRLSEKGLLIGIDRDTEALNAANENLKEFQNYKLVHGNHDEIRKILDDLNIDKVDGILMDLGVSSYQLDEKSRGFSYSQDDKLDMRMDQTQKLSAFEVVNFYHEKDLANLIFAYGEERYSREIARNICNARKEGPIRTTGDLVKIIEKSKPASKDGHPAKRTFQAIRIEVNNELKPLHNTVMESIKSLKPGGRLCIITFHSLEDREVKRAFQEAEGKSNIPPELSYGLNQVEKLGTIITKKPIEASKEEQKNNSRSLSAKLRVFERE